MTLNLISDNAKGQWFAVQVEEHCEQRGKRVRQRCMDQTLTVPLNGCMDLFDLIYSDLSNLNCLRSLVFFPPGSNGTLERIATLELGCVTSGSSTCHVIYAHFDIGSSSIAFSPQTIC